MKLLTCIWRTRIEGTCKFGNPCAHKYCDECKELSMPPATSDWWVCCKCLNLNDYDKRRRLRDIKRKHDMRLSTAWTAIDAWGAMPQAWEHVRWGK